MKKSSTVNIKASSARSSDLTCTIFNAKLRRVLEVEKRDAIIYSVREDLMSRVNKECNELYMKKQCVKFHVHCGYRALLDIAQLEFIRHDPGSPYYVNHPKWKADLAEPPSIKDSWATSNVKIPSNFTSDGV